MMQLTPCQRSIYQERLSAEKGRARFEALLHVLRAMDDGIVGRRNKLRMDEEVNSCIIKFLRKEGVRYKYSMPEQIEAKALGERQLFHLPAPISSVPQNVARESNTLKPRDHMNWKALPEEDKKGERERLHSFLFP